MFIIQYLLLPFAGLYNLVTRVRNYLYDIGHKKSFQFDTIVISVGNLNAGGSGKTPLIEYLVRLLIDHKNLATLSRGYGRKTHGIRIANLKDDARSIGDEPFQLMRKFGDKIVVAVGEERALAIPTILNENPEVEVILLDDAFQHRAVRPQFSILVTDREKPFYKDYLLPMGRLRESRTGAKRANVIVVTKADGISKSEMEMARKEIAKYAGDAPVFFSGLSYQQHLPINHSNEIDNKVVLVSAIANNTQFERAASKRYEVARHFRFPDHHVYSNADIQKIHLAADAMNVNSILTTEKDMVKLISQSTVTQLEGKNWFYLPVRAEFLEDGMRFDELIQNVVERETQLDEEENINTEQ
jgi:tetraacyldisaccharide 4'-kinase